MSSYELLELFGVIIIDDAEAEERTIRVDFPPEDGAVALAMRGGERPVWQQMLAQSANELAVMRATYAQDADADIYDARLFFSEAKLRGFEAERQRKLAELKQIQADGKGGMSDMWTLKEVN